MQRQNDTLFNLPPDIISNEIAPKLDSATIASSMQVSHAWHKMFDRTDTWKTLITRDFGIPLCMLNQFVDEAKKINPTSPPDFKIIYKHLHILSKRQNSESYFLNNYHLQLLACCSNRTDYATQLLPYDEWPIWQEAAKNAECDALLPMLIGRKNLDFTFFMGAWANNQYCFMKFLFECGIKPLNWTYFDNVLRSSSLAFVQLAVECIPEMGRIDLNDVLQLLFTNQKLTLSDIDSLLHHSALQIVQKHRPSEELIRKLIAHPVKNQQEKAIQKRWLRIFLSNAKNPDLAIDYSVFSSLIRFGLNDEAIYFSKAFQQKSPYLFSHSGLLIHAALSGNLEHIRRILNTSGINFSLIGYAINGNQFETFIALLDPKLMKDSHFSIQDDDLLAAAHQPNPAFLAYMLDPKTTCGIKPTQDVLDRAVTLGRRENVALLLQPQFNLHLTQEMLMSSYGDASFFKFIFQLKTRPSATQSMLNRQLEREGEETERWLIIKLLLDHNVHLTVTQNQFENLFAAKSYYLWEQLLNYTCLNLKGTTATLERAIWQNRLDYVKRLVEEFKLKPTQEMLDIALEYNAHDIVVYLLHERFHLSLELEAFKNIYGRLKDPAYFLFLYSKCKPTQDIIDFIIRQYNSKYAIAFLQHNIKFDYTIALMQSIYSRNRDLFGYECTRLLLEPELHLTLNEGSFGMLIDQAISAYIFKSDLSLKKSLRLLNNNQISDAELEFTRAFELSPRQCFRLACYALTHPMQYGLDENGMHALTSFVQNTMSKLEKLTIIERNTIKTYLENVQLADSRLHFAKSM